MRKRPGGQFDEESKQRSLPRNWSEKRRIAGEAGVREIETSNVGKGREIGVELGFHPAILEVARVRDERTTPMAVKYLYRNEPIEVSRYCCEFIFQVEGSQPGRIGVVVNGGWHEAIPSLGWKGDERNLIAIAKGFLEKALAGGRAPTAENNRLEIPEEKMEYRVQNGSFPG